MSFGRAALCSLLAVACVEPEPARPAGRERPARELWKLEAPAEVDFGEVHAGLSAPRSFAVRNASAVAMWLDGIEVEGRDAELLELVVHAPKWLEPGEVLWADIMLRSNATLVTQHEAKLRLRSPAPDVEVVVRWAGVFVDCAFDRELDFGHAPIGETYEVAFPIVNTAGTPSPMWVEAIDGPFSLVDAGTGSTQPGDSRGLVLAFHPDSDTRRLGFMRLRRHALCDGQTVELRGWGVDSVLGCGGLSPSTCPVGQRCPARLTLTNLSRREVDVSDLVVGPSPELQLAGDGGAVTVPAKPAGSSQLPWVGGTVQVPVTIAPSAAGLLVAEASGTVQWPRHPPLRCPRLTVLGGGPQLEVTPTLLDLQTRTVGAFTVRNVSTATANDPAWLDFAQPEVERLGPGNAVLTVSPDDEPAYRLVSGQSKGFTVVVSPGDAGLPTEWQIRVSSTDFSATDGGLRVQALP